MWLEPEPKPDRPFPPLCFLTVPLSRVVQNAQVGFITFANAAERKNDHVLDGWTTKAACMLQSHTVQPDQVNQGAGQKGVNCSENFTWKMVKPRNSEELEGRGLQTWQNPFLCICQSRRGASWISVMDSAILDVEIPSFSHTVPFILNPYSPWKSSQHQARATSPGTVSFFYGFSDMGPQTAFGVIFWCCQSSWTSGTVLHPAYPQPGPSSFPSSFAYTSAPSVQLCLTLDPSKGGFLVTLSQINLFLQLYLSLGVFYTSLLAFVFSPEFQHDISDFFWKTGKCFRCLIRNT